MPLQKHARTRLPNPALCQRTCCVSAKYCVHTGEVCFGCLSGETTLPYVERSPHTNVYVCACVRAYICARASESE